MAKNHRFASVNINNNSSVVIVLHVTRYLPVVISITCFNEFFRRSTSSELILFGLLVYI